MPTPIVYPVVTSWVCPAGVTEVLMMPWSSSSSFASQAISLTVVPNTTYTITINSPSYSYGTPNTFGTSYSWAGSGWVEIIYVDGNRITSSVIGQT